MKPPEHLKPQGGRLNLTPMVDVVFLLIIFFIVSTNMIQQDQAVVVDLPAAESGILPEEQRTNRLTVSIVSQGIIYVGAERVDLERLRRIIQRCRNDWGDEAEIQVRTDKNVHYGLVKPILRVAAESGIISISFAVVSS